MLWVSHALAPLQALAAYAGALAADPAHIPSLLGCASMYKDSGLLEDALRMLERAAAVAPHEDEVARALAMVLTDLGEQPTLPFTQQCEKVTALMIFYERRFGSSGMHPSTP